MPLLLASRLSMHYTGPTLLDGVSAAVEKGRRIGVIGPNGAGKSTFLKLLDGRLEPTGGEVVRQRGVRVAYQAQELEYEPGRSVFNEMRAIFQDESRREERLRELEERIAAGESDLLKEYEQLEGGRIFDLDRRIERMLSSLGIPDDAWHRPVAEFSGGERNVLGLARVLLAEPDVLLLDEPSNHLDMDGVEWFIDFVRRSPAAVVMVSHNRHLLDATAHEIWELDHARITKWTGNYSDYVRQKEEAIALQQKQHKNQQRLIQRIRFQARRLMDMANAYDDPGQARRAKAMLKRIEHMDIIDAPDTGEKRFFASLKSSGRHGRIALQVKGFCHAYGDRVLFDRAELEIEFGDRVCLVGPNGSGKTTLFRHILDQGSWEHPILRLGKSVRVGEYRQLHDALDPDKSLQDWAAQVTGLTYTEAAKLLHRFRFTRDDLERPIRTLSGGEKSRLQLARLVHAQVNFLMLDEPTNHLDIAACEQLEEMLQDYEGTLFIISHDRYFLDKLVNRVVEVADQKLVYHRQSFAEWWQERHGGAGRRTALLDRREKSDKAGARRQFEERKARSRELDKLRRKVSELEGRIEALEARQEALQAKLEAAYSAGDRAEELSREFAGVRDRLDEAYREWESVAAALDE